MSRLSLRRAALAIVAAALAVFAPPARAGTLVQLDFTNTQTTFGSVQIDLFDDLTPKSVANFEQYINANLYNNTMVHRVDTGLGVIQAGGYTTDGNHITNLAPIVNEYSRANTRGTISMARTSDPNSATSEFFINTVDNSTTLGPANDGIGYAVFGWVVGGGMSIVDKIQNTPTNGGFTSPFSQLPLVNFTPGTAVSNDNLILLSNVSIVKTHPSFQNPISPFDANNDNTTSTLDALVIINDLITKGAHAVANPFSGTNYLDVTGDGQVSPLDALQVINHFLPGGAPVNGAQASALSLSAAPLSIVVPEPSAWILAAAGEAILLGLALRRRVWRSCVHARPQ